ncbi:MAG: PKD domain-containing protein [Euryarchaeota archaeon]|nr:PKD domain-containing protein [Euryarchaeota archaeon]
MRKIIQLTIVVILLLFLQASTLACTIFSADDGTMTLAGTNGDYSDTDTYIVFYPAENGKHGRMYAGWKQFWWQTGLNDQGLFYASASTSFLEAQNSTQKPRPSQYLMYKCLEECSTVEDVLEVFDQYNLYFLETMQLIISDATGASVIIEGDPLHFKQNYYQVVTNFRLSQTNPPYPCWRYNTAVAMFENTTTISLEFFTSICDATHQERGTQFSTVCDLQQKIIYLYRQYNYNQVKIFNLTEEIQSGYHIYSIQSLFTTSNSPTKPTTPQGKREGTIGQNYTYSTSSTDSDGDQISYVFDWGDGSISGWLGPYTSGVTCEAKHIWNIKGNYDIKVKAKDIYGAESSWSDPLPITMPYSYNPILQFLELLFQYFPHAFPLLRQLLG